MHLVAIAILACLLTGCAPAPVEAPLETPRGYAVVPPAWLPREQWGPLLVLIDEYVSLYESLADDRVPAHRLRIRVANGKSAGEADHVDGWFAGTSTTIDLGISGVYSREILLVWARDNGAPRAWNPFPAFLHELLHDRQWREGREVSHRWTREERDVEGAGHDADLRLEEAR